LRRQHALRLAAAVLLPACTLPPLCPSYSLDHRHRLELRLGARGTTVERDGQPLGRYLLVDQDSLRLSPSGRHAAYVARTRDGWHLYVDAQPQPQPWDGLLAGSLHVSEAGEAVAVMRRGPALYVVRGARSEGPYDGVTALQTGQDAAAPHLAYLARRGAQAFAVVDGKAYGPYEALAELALGPRGGDIALIARQKGRWWVHLYRGGQASAWPHDSVAGLRFSADGDRLYYVARDGERERLTEARPPGEQAGPPLPHIDWRSLKPRPGAAAPVYVAYEDGARFVVRGGAPGPAYDAIRELSVAGDRIGYIGRRGAGEQVVLDDTPGPWFRAVGGLVLTGSGGHAYLAEPRGGGLQLVTHRGITPLSWGLAGSLALCEGGDHIALLGGLVPRALQVLIDGQAVRTFDGEEPEAVRRTWGPAGLQRWLTEELRPRCAADADRAGPLRKPDN
jgi:hypothetical protein